jgi:hypothetical protein
LANRFFFQFLTYLVILVAGPLSNVPSAASYILGRTNSYGTPPAVLKVKIAIPARRQSASLSSQRTTASE